MRIRKFAYLLLICISFLQVDSAHSKPLSYKEIFKQKVVEKKLPNGITILAMNYGYSPTLALIISFKVGSVNETYRTIGAAHMLEHMLFKGTDRIGTKDFKKEKPILEEIEKTGDKLDRMVMKDPDNAQIPALKQRLERLQKEHEKYVVSSPYDKIYTTIGGVRFNAGTSRDRTTYYISIPAAKLETWAGLESERLRRPVLREYYRERNTVLEERLMRYDSKGMEGLFEKFIATAFIAHPYRHPIIGWRSNIPFLSIKDVRDFYYRNYTPYRMIITVVGKQDIKNTVRIIEKHFSKLKGGEGPSPVVVKEPSQKGERRIVHTFDANPYLLIGWHKPTYPSRDDYICDVIDGLLSDGKTSRLYRSLVVEKKMAVSVSAWNGYPGAIYDNLFVIAAQPRSPHTTAELESAIYEEIEKLKKDLGPDELKKVISRTEASFLFELENNMGVATTLSYFQVVFNDWKYILGYMDEIKNVTPEDIKGVLNRYFIQNNRTVGILEKTKEGNQE